MKILKIKLEYWLPGITIGDSGARQPVVISTENLQTHIFFVQQFLSKQVVTSFGCLIIVLLALTPVSMGMSNSSVPG